MDKLKILIMFILLIAALLKSEENYILKNGKKLSLDMKKIAIALKINNPEGIRVLEKNKIFGFNDIGGMAINRTILCKKGLPVETTNEIIAHELVHVKQYQDAGGIYNYLKEYYKEIKKYGYYDAPLEVEARIKSEVLLDELDKEEI